MALVHHDFGGTGPVLLMLHANGVPSHAYIPMVQHLKAHFRCIALDLSGQGASPELGPNRTVAAQQADVLSKIRELDLNGCYCFGHSGGAALALLLSLSEDPSSRVTFKAVYGFEPIVTVVHGTQLEVGEGKHPTALVAAALKRKDRWPSMEAARAALGGRPPFKAFHADAFDAYLQYGLRTVRPEGDGAHPGGVTLVCRPETEASMYGSFFPPPHADWSRMPCPVVIAVGGGGGAFDAAPKIGLKLSQALPVARCHTFPSLGHLGALEDPQAVALDIIRVFAEVAATGTLAPQPRL